tara:strand:+ start:11598 stop:12314 length:717 start_codon:yes stop_codon:yes gene_type:complete
MTDPDQTPQFLDTYDVILLDQGRTFMFELDRFGPDQDFHSTYLELGGGDLRQDQVQDLLVECLSLLRSAYDDPSRQDDVPTPAEILDRLAPDISLPERMRLVDVVGWQEAGTISDAHAATIRRLASSHPLGIVSNVWGPAHVFEENLARHGILDCFRIRTWSSDHRCVKPSHRLFEHALRQFDAPRDRIVYVGDDPGRDVPPAKNLGMGAVWIDHGTGERPPMAPDLVIHDLSELPDA